MPRLQNPPHTNQALITSLNNLPYPTPYMLINLAQLERRYVELQQALKRVEFFYAVKANNHSTVIKTFAALGLKFEIASVNELQQLIEHGITPNRISYSHPIKPWQHIQKAYALGVTDFAFDSVGELEKLSKYAPGAKLYLRYAVNDQGSTFPLSKKFGAEPQDIVSLMSMAKDLGFEPYGLTFHVGSQGMNPRMWELGIKMAGDAMEDLLQQGLRIQVLNIGGGFPAYYGQEAPRFKTIGETIARAAARYLPYQVRLLAEPGRALVAEAGTYVTSIIGRVERGGKNWLHLDLGAFNGMIETLETANQFHFPLATSRSFEGNQERSLFNLTGPTCDPQDALFYDVALPHSLMIDDKIYIFSAGAYSIVYASSFNGFGPPKVYSRRNDD